MSGLTTAPVREAAVKPVYGGHSLLELDPELGRLLTPERYARACADVRVKALRRAPGPWSLKAALTTAPHLGLLVLDGVIASDVILEDLVSTELLGAGDLLRPRSLADPDRLVGDVSHWIVLAQCRFAVLDQRSAVALARYPEIYAVLLERMDVRARRLARAQAITALNRVERRLLAMLWHLAERWGRMTPDGLVIPLDISHRLLAQLVGARRPTVSTAIGQLARDGRVARRADGAWVLHGEPPGEPNEGTESILSRRRLRIAERSSASHDPGGADVDELEFRLRRLRREADALQRELTDRCGMLGQ